MELGSLTLEPSKSPAIPHTQEDTTIPPITMEAILIMEGLHTTTVVLGIAMGMEEATIRIVPLPQHLPRRT